MKRSVSSTTRLRPYRHAANLPRVAAIVILVMTWPGHGWAARVSGVLVGYENSAPLVSRDLHFQNVLTGDVYLSPTHSDGSFGTILPPGTYRLRTETGAILASSILVGRTSVDIGRVSEQAPLAPQRLWQAQAIAPTLLTSPAPSTAYLMTSDKTPLPSTATVVPRPEIDWTRPPPETQASQPPVISGMTAAPLPRTASAAASPSSSWMGGGAPYIPPLAKPGSPLVP